MRDFSYYLEFLNSLQQDKIVPGLDRMRQAASELEIFPFTTKTITVGGTNGKGSCVALLEALYLEAGYRVGSYISPHLFSFTERIRVQGQAIDEKSICEIFEKIVPLQKKNRVNLF